MDLEDFLMNEEEDCPEEEFEVLSEEEFEKLSEKQELVIKPKKPFWWNEEYDEILLLSKTEPEIMTKKRTNNSYWYIVFGTVDGKKTKLFEFERLYHAVWCVERYNKLKGGE